MGNNSTPNSKLDETVKDSLNNYEARYDAGDWSRMEKMLDAAPATSAGSISYGKIAIIGAALVLGTFLIYKVVNSGSTDKEISNQPTETTTPPSETNKVSEPAVTVTSPPAVATNTVVTSPTPKIETEKFTPPAVSTTNAVKPAAENTGNLATKKETKTKTKSEDAEYNKTQKVSVMGNEPIFGDMIDSSKGVIHSTKEKESTKQKAKTKGTSTVGLGNIFSNINVNLDSLKKYNESIKKDSIHQ